ncbi:hypothetical protein [Paenibacillus massiliensis]|uniref:hypothetical protein n=1 Tax=Paenibacillus massiliensis TaxID=225917 RepID=UPI00035F0C4A|nr:hypothetical protein [Paenibacillus massiliensis]
MRKLSSCVLSFVLLFLTIIPSVGANASVSVVDTPIAYIDYLESLPNHSIAGLDAFNTSNEPERQEFIDGFKNLSEKDQQRFVDYLNDPEFAKKVYEAQPTDVLASKVTLFNGDVEVSSDVEFFDDIESNSNISLQAVGDSYFPYGKHTATTTVMGLDIIKTSVYLHVEIKEVKKNTSQIVQILESGGIVDRNYYPALDLSKNESSAFLTSDKTLATKKVIWGWNFLWSGFGMVVGNREQWVQINKAGNITGGAANL